MPRSKRKFDGEDEAATQANRDIPTPETQDLYDAMRRIEEQLPLGDQLRLRSGPTSNDEHGDLLRPPSPSQAPTSPRSPSCPSTTHSVTRGFDDVGLDEEERRTKRRAVRHGPLDALNRAKAALMRKLGACADCRFRKVKCTHFDRTIFEERYQACKRGEQRLRYSEQFTTVSPQTSFNNGTVSQIGSWQPPSLLPQTAPGIQHDEAEAEILAIEEGVRGSAPSSAPTAAPYYFANPERISQYSFHGMNSLSPYLAPPNQFSFDPAAQDDTSMPIGRRIGGQGVIMFECRHGDNNSSEVVDEATVCNHRFPSVPELCQHFQTDHSPFSRTFRLWKCTVRRIGEDGRERVCGFMADERANRSCLLCQGSSWETWYYCTVIRTPSLTSGPSVRVDSRDGSLFGGPRPFGAPYPFGSSSAQPDIQWLFPERYMGPNQTGSYHSFGAKAKSPDTKAKDHCFRGMTVYPQGCPYGKKCRSLTQPSEHITRAQILLAISVLSLVIMEQWLVAGVSLIGSKGVASAVVHVVRNHVFWMSLPCLVAGFSGMWLFKHVRFRTARNSQASSCGTRCIPRGFFSNSANLDIEDAGSIRGDDDGMDPDGAGYRRATKLMVD